MVLCLFIFLVSSTLANSEELKVQFAIGEWEPYTGETIENYGMAAEIVTAACKPVGITPEYHFYPWKRAEMSVSDGTSFGTFPYKEIPERKDKFYFSKPLLYSSFGILMHKKNQKVSKFEFTRIEDFKNFKIGIVAGTDAVRIPLEKIGVKIEEVQDTATNIKKLEFARIDFTIDDKAVLNQALKTNYASNLEKISEFGFTKNDFGQKNEFCIMVSRNYPKSEEILEKINEGLTQIKAKGEYNKILSRYGLNDPGN